MEMKNNLELETVEALAVAVDTRMAKAASERGLMCNYVTSLERLGEFVSDGNFDTAIELIVQMAAILDIPAKRIIVDVIQPDPVAVEGFLLFFHEYIEDWYVLECMLPDDFDDEFDFEDEDAIDPVIEETDEKDNFTAFLNVAYEAVKKLLRKEEKKDEQGEGDFYM